MSFPHVQPTNHHTKGKKDQIIIINASFPHYKSGLGSRNKSNSRKTPILRLLIQSKISIFPSLLEVFCHFRVYLQFYLYTRNLLPAGFPSIILRIFIYLSHKQVFFCQDSAPLLTGSFGIHGTFQERNNPQQIVRATRTSFNQFKRNYHLIHHSESFVIR